MKKSLCLTLLFGSLLSITGCIDEVGRHHSRPGYYEDGHHHSRSGYYENGSTRSRYETHRDYQDDRRGYDDGYHRRETVRVYDAPPQPRRADVRVSF